MSKPRPVRFAMLLLPAFNAMACSAFIDPLRAANYLQANRLFDWRLLSLDGDAVSASNSMQLQVDASLQDCPPDFDYVVVNASWAPERFVQPSLQHWLRQAVGHRAKLVGIDTGAFVLGNASLMKGHQAVVHYEHLEAYLELFPRSRANAQLYCIDRDRISCGGGFAAAQLALALVRQHAGLDLANAAAQYLSIERLREGDEPQLDQTLPQVGSDCLPKIFREAVILMEQNLEEPLRLLELARYAGCSQRQLERLFKRHSGLSPRRYYLNLRLDRARALLTQTEYTLAQIASACGFNKPEQFTRAYKQHFGLLPSRDRISGRVPFEFRSRPRFNSL